MGAAGAAEPEKGRGPAARLILVTVPDCHLCVRARAEVAAIAAEAGVAWAERDLTVTGAPDPLWWEQLPLVLVDGKVACYWRVEPAAVRAALAAAEPEAG